MDGWFFFDAFELLDEKVPTDSKPIGSRYDHQISIFGKKWQEKAAGQNVFLVGCGALGCEYLKAISMIGLGAETGKISITDDDRIELSNLSRQFLFRREHVGKPKSTSAVEAGLKMNPALAKTLKAYEVRVETKSEDIFDDAFWNNLDFVLNALDNNIARRYTDSKCVFHGKPLFESGTLGTQANTVICLPGKTPSYSEGAVAGENQGIAQCTLRNFPFQDLHCIEWAREMFNELFAHGPDAQNSFLENREKFYQKLAAAPLEERSTLEKVKRWLDLSKAPTFELCIEMAIDQFLKFFRDGINDLITNFPEDARVKDTSTNADLGPFWHGHKRFPRSANFDPKNDQHLDYIFAAANILASVFCVPEIHDKEEVRKKAAAAKIRAYQFSGAKIKLDEPAKPGEKKEEKEPEVVTDDDKQVVEQLKGYLNGLNAKSYRKLKAADFEKDDDTNHHIDWITQAANLRCFNYYIKETTRANCRMIAGRIIPAIATTTAMITGFVQLEVYKYIKGSKLEDMRAATVNLGTNVFCVENLPDPRRKKTGMDPESYMQCTAIPEGFTCWDKIEIKKPGITLEEFMNEFTAVHFGAKITTLTSINGKILYNDFSDQKAIAENKKMKLIDLYVRGEGPVHPATRPYIILVAAGVDDKEGNSAVCPLIVYHWK
jgi:ubiquitin-activating enzyme E1